MVHICIRRCQEVEFLKILFRNRKSTLDLIVGLMLGIIFVFFVVDTLGLQDCSGSCGLQEAGSEQGEDCDMRKMRVLGEPSH